MVFAGTHTRDTYIWLDVLYGRRHRVTVTLGECDMTSREGSGGQMREGLVLDSIPPSMPPSMPFKTVVAGVSLKQQARSGDPPSPASSGAADRAAEIRAMLAAARKGRTPPSPTHTAASTGKSPLPSPPIIKEPTKEQMKVFSGADDCGSAHAEAEKGGMEKMGKTSRVMEEIIATQARPIDALQGQDGMQLKLEQIKKLETEQIQQQETAVLREEHMAENASPAIDTHTDSQADPDIGSSSRGQVPPALLSDDEGKL